jgi:hypothetical protein
MILHCLPNTLSLSGFRAKPKVTQNHLFNGCWTTKWHWMLQVLSTVVHIHVWKDHRYHCEYFLWHTRCMKMARCLLMIQSANTGNNIQISPASQLPFLVEIRRHTSSLLDRVSKYVCMGEKKFVVISIHKRKILQDPQVWNWSRLMCGGEGNSIFLGGDWVS